MTVLPHAGVNSARISCQVPGVPVPISGAAALAQFAGAFTGVAFTPNAANQGAFLQFSNIPEVLILAVWLCVIIHISMVLFKLHLEGGATSDSGHFSNR